MKDKFTELVKRRHPRYAEMIDHWNFLEATYEGGRSWFRDNIFRYLKEGDQEYRERVERSYRFNHTKQVVDTVDKYLFKMPIARREADAPEAVRNFWKRATLTGLDINVFARRISNATSRVGRVYVVVDSDFIPGAAVASVAERKEVGGGAYAYIVMPQDMLDMAYDDRNNLLWALVREVGRDDEDPLESSGNPVIRYRLWTRTDWHLFEEQVVRGKPKVVKVDERAHGLGIVPIVQADHQFSEEVYESSGLIDDIAYLDRANANYLSNLDAIIQDQTFSQLTMPAQGLMPGEEGEKKLVTMGTSRVFTYNAEAGMAPAYISPDPRQAGMILSAIGKIINEIYHSVGLSGERTKDDNGGGVDNSSGVAKAYDFERINSLLTAKAASLELVETKIMEIVCLWEGVDAPSERLITYPDKFDTRSLYDEFEIAARLSLLTAPDEVRRMQMQVVTDKLFPAASEEQRKKLEAALKKWPPEPVEGTVTGPGSKNPIKEQSTQKTAKELTS